MTTAPASLSGFEGGGGEEGARRRRQQQQQSSDKNRSSVGNGSSADTSSSTVNSRSAEYIREYNAIHRPKSLMELHKEALAAAQKEGGGSSGSGGGIRRPFDREKDLDIRRPVNVDKIAESAGANLQSMFSSGSYANSFV